MGIIIQKYGGTSLNNLDENSKIIKHVKDCIEEGNRLVIVVSAIGRKGEPYATDTLIEQLNKISEKIDPKKKDLMMSCGELISTAIVSHLLDSQGLPSEALAGFQAGILTNDEFTDSDIIDINVKSIKKHLKEGKIVVIAGFQGITKDGEITTLGRGGSDTTAATLGGYLGADRVDIFTDVPGVAFLDPKLIPNTKYIKNISYDHMYNFARNGARVIHDKAVTAGKRFNIPIRILSPGHASQGTLISNIDQEEKIIGITVKKGEDYATLSIIFKKEFKDEIIDELKEFNKNNKNSILDVQYFEDKIAYIISIKELDSFAQKLYDFSIK